MVCSGRFSHLAVKALGVVMEPQRSWVWEPGGWISVLSVKQLVMTAEISYPLSFFYPPVKVQ